MNSETKEKLLGLANYSSDAIDEFIPEYYEDIEEDFQLKVYLKSLTVAEKKHYNNTLATKSIGTLEADAENMLRKKIVSLENHYDLGTDKYIQFTKDENGIMSKEVYETIAQPVRISILERLLLISGLSSIKKKQ